MPFSLKNTPTHFQHTIDIILGAYHWDFILVYIDDILIFSQTFEDHMKHVSLIFDALHNVGFTVDERKCHWCYDDLDVLGHHISRLQYAARELDHRQNQRLRGGRNLHEISCKHIAIAIIHDISL